MARLVGFLLLQAAGARATLPVAAMGGLLDPGGFPTPPKTTPFQASLFDKVNAAAATASAAAEPALLAALDDPEFRGQLRDCCGSELAMMTAERLLARLKRDVLAAELTHNFNANGMGWEGDINIEAAAAMDYYPNLWTIIYLNLTLGRGSFVEEDFAEVYIMGFKQFSGNQTVGKAAPKTFDEAAERPLYTTANLLHIDNGNPLFGDVSMIVMPSYGHSMALIEACDTGNWEDGCNVTGPANAQCHYPQPLNCSAWDMQQGTFNHFSHSLLANINLWDSSKNCTGDVLARYFARLYEGYGDNGGSSSSLYKLKMPDLLTYMEPDLAGTVRYPDGIKLVVATFGSLFGTELGRKVQAFCKKWGWVLAWALSTADKTTFDVDHRVIDPEVLANASAGHNLTVSAAASAQFASLWQAANTTTRAGTDWVKTWHDLMYTAPELGMSAGIRGDDCSDIDRCIGVSTSTGKCVCYAAEAEAEVQPKPDAARPESTP